MAHILEANGLRDTIGTCFEFGAWDGVFASNCRWWLEQGWSGIMAEVDAGKMQTLRVNYRNLPDVALVHTAVTDQGESSIYNLAATYGGGREIDILSIDVDGLDYLLLSSLKAYPDFKPGIIIVECNGFIRPDLSTPLSPQVSSNNLQQSLSVFRDVGRELGYRLVCFTQNAILVREDLAKQLAYPEAVNRLYYDALVINWNDMLLNVDATRGPKILKSQYVVVLQSKHTRSLTFEKNGQGASLQRRSRPRRRNSRSSRPRSISTPFSHVPSPRRRVCRKILSRTPQERAVAWTVRGGVAGGRWGRRGGERGPLPGGALGSGRSGSMGWEVGFQGIG